jgi:outer membrane protein assembly factor BamD
VSVRLNRARHFRKPLPALLGRAFFFASVAGAPTRLLSVAGVSAALLAGAGCATSDDGSAELTYSLTAKQNYDKGIEAAKEENFPDAVRYLSFVKQKFPFSRYAVLAELSLADVQFQRGSYQEAIDSYKTFARLHPTHEKVEDGYVAYKIAECYVEDMPTDWALVPPAYEKDQSAVRDAHRELSDFIDKYPDSTYIKDAKKLHQQVMGRLIEHEVYVARFYLDGGHPKAAILRIEAALRQYPDSGREAELLLVLGQTHLELGNARRARQTFERVVKDFGAGLEAKRAALFLDFIKREHGDNPTDANAHG